MKRALYIVFTALVALMILPACDGGKDFDTPDNTINPNDIIDPTSVGYISLSSFALSVSVDEEGFTDNDGGSSTASASRADEATFDTNSFIVSIVSESTGESVHCDSYKNSVAMDGYLTLSAGYYLLKVYSSQSAPDSTWDSSEVLYASSEERLVVGDERVTQIGEVKCKMSMIKTQVALAADMLSLFDTDDEEYPFSVTLEYGDESLVFDESRLYDSTLEDNVAGYFAEQEGESTIGITLSGMYNAGSQTSPDYVHIVWTNEISSVAAGQSRMIYIKIDNYDAGQIQISFEVQSWSYDSPLGVNIFSESFALLLSEDVIFDPDNETTDDGSAVVTAYSAGVALSDSYDINLGLFNDAAEVYSPVYSVVVAPQGGASIESLYVDVSSENDLFVEALEAAGYEDGRIYMWGDEAQTSALAQYLSISESGDITITLKYAGARALYTYAGVHTFKVVATDDQNRRSYTTLTIDVTSSELPTITWSDGDFDTIYEIYPSTSEESNPTVNLEISSYVCIESLSIAITSPVLTESLLSGMGLATTMDLANPASEKMESVFGELGLPYGDDVSGARSVNVDISTFMALLADLAYTEDSATTIFEITVSDSVGECVETLTVVRNYN